MHLKREKLQQKLFHKIMFMQMITGLDMELCQLTKRKRKRKPHLYIT